MIGHDWLFLFCLMILILYMFYESQEDFVYIKTSLRKDYMPKKFGWM